MHVCVCVYMCVHVCVHVCACVHVCVHVVCACVRVCYVGEGMEVKSDAKMAWGLAFFSWLGMMQRTKCGCVCVSTPIRLDSCSCEML